MKDVYLLTSVYVRQCSRLDATVSFHTVAVLAYG
jgi:hypothetical protein